MSLSKRRDRDRKRLARSVQPQSNPNLSTSVQPKPMEDVRPSQHQSNPTRLDKANTKPLIPVSNPTELESYQPTTPIKTVQPKPMEDVKSEYKVGIGKCPICNRIGPIHQHHPDYSKPNETIGVCVSCHKKIHLFLKGEQRTTSNPYVNPQPKLAKQLAKAGIKMDGNQVSKGSDVKPVPAKRGGLASLLS